MGVAEIVVNALLKKNMGAVEVFFENIKKGFRHGNPF